MPCRQNSVTCGPGRCPAFLESVRRRRWARRGTRPSAPHDQWMRSTYIFGAICPAGGAAAGLVLPRCNTAAMALHLDETSRTVAPDAHAVLLLDQAGWYVSDKLDVPENITLTLLPPKSPELNPVKTSGSSCATTGSRTASSSPTTKSRPLLLRLEQIRQSTLGLSCPSVFAIGAHKC